MSYDKLSLASFTAALKEGKYESATGARRAVGKAQTLSEGDKDKARKAIDAHFGSAPAAAPKKASAKKAAAKKASAAPKKAASAKPQVNKPAAAPKKKAAAKKTSAKRGARTVGTTSHDADYVEVKHAQVGSVGLPNSTVDLDNLGSISTQLRLAEKTIQNVGAALNVVTQAKKEYPDADLASVVEDMGTTLSGAVGIFRAVVNEASKQMIGTSTIEAPAQPQIPQIPPPVVQTEGPRTGGIINNGVTSRAESLFNESQPQDQQQPA